MDSLLLNNLDKVKLKTLVLNIGLVTLEKVDHAIIIKLFECIMIFKMNILENLDINIIIEGHMLDNIIKLSKFFEMMRIQNISHEIIKFNINKNHEIWSLIMNVKRSTIEIGI